MVASIRSSLGKQIIRFLHRSENVCGGQVLNLRHSRESGKILKQSSSRYSDEMKYRWTRNSDSFECVLVLREQLDFHQ